MVESITENGNNNSNNSVTQAVVNTDFKLNLRYTFEEFIVGPHDRFTHAAALAVADNPGKIYNPFFIYGGVGLGKTHLMQAIGHRVSNKNPQMRILFVTVEKFTSEVIDAIAQGNIQSFRDRYRNLDLLLVDDVQFLAESESTQEEFFHTFNILYENGKQIVCTSDRPPKQLASLTDRIRSRFEWGLIADIKPPNLETRVAILKKKSEREHLSLDDNILLYIAGKLKSNIRELEGCLKRISAYANITGQEIDMLLVKSVLHDLLPESEWEEETAADTGLPPQTKRVIPPAAVPQKTVVPVQYKIDIESPKVVTKKVEVTPPAVTVVTPVVPLSASGTTPAEEEVDMSLKPVEVVFFYPEKKDAEFQTMKVKFRDVVKKHKLKFRLKSVLEKEYSCTEKLNYAFFINLCKTNKIRIAVMLGPPEDLSVLPSDFIESLSSMMSGENISLQFLSFQEVNKEYRYLNLALDITLIKQREMLK